jgi:2-iminobutanoate/2-iminopropanoate deaminase
MRAVATEKAPRAIGPYSQAVVCGPLVFASGQIPLDPETGEPVDGGIEVQTRRVLDNLREVLAEAGSSLDRVAKTTVFLADMSDFARMNEAYAEYFGTPAPPARSCVEAAALPRGVAIEIEAVALADPAS